MPIPERYEELVAKIIEECLDGTRAAIEGIDPGGMTQAEAAAIGVCGLTLSLATWALACDDELSGFINGEDLVVELASHIRQEVTKFLENR